MTARDLWALAPLWIPVAAIVVALLALAFRRHHALTATITVVGLVAALAAAGAAGSEGDRRITDLLVLDRYGIALTVLILTSALAVVLLAYGYLRNQREQREELYVLVLTGTVGALVLVASTHFAALFLGLEILSVSLFALIAYLRRAPTAVEAGLKYLVLASTSSAILLFGMALVYAATGALEFTELGRRLAAGRGSGALAVSGLSLMLVGFGFKLALVPFHMWTGDVYQGSSAPVTAFVATVSKVAMVGALIRTFSVAAPSRGATLTAMFAVVAASSMIVGTLLALRQTELKRLLAYSSIAHLGYILVAFLLGGAAGQEAVFFYLVVYAISLLGAFGVLAALASPEGEVETIDQLRGLYWTRPFAAAVFTASLLSLAGMPFTAGFVAKLYVLAAGVDAGWWTLAVLLVTTSAVGLYYYLRVLTAMAALPAIELPRHRRVLPLGAGVVLAAMGLLLLAFGVYPRALAAALVTALTGV